MDLRYFLLLLRKRIWLLLLLFVTAAAATFLLMSRLPRTYKSAATISTGIVDFQGITVDKENVFVQQFQIDNKFNNLIEYIRSRPILKMMTMELMAHDLDPNGTPFMKREESKDFSETELDSYCQDFWTRREDTLSDLSSTFLNSNLAREVEKLYGYDYENLLENLDVKRVGETDFVRFEFKSEDAKLSQFALQQFLKRFIQHYYNEQGGVESSSVAFYSDLVASRKHSLDSLKSRLNAYNQNRGLVNLEDQGKAVVAQLRDLEIAREQEAKNIKGFELAYEKMKAENEKHGTGVSSDQYFKNLYSRVDLSQINEQISELNKRHAASGLKDKNIEKQLEEARSKRSKIINQYTSNPTEKQTIVTDEQRANYIRGEIDYLNKLQISKESVVSLDNAIGALRTRKSSLVSDNAFIGNLEQEVMLAANEYSMAVEKYNTARVNLQVKEQPLKILEHPSLALKPESSGRVIFSAFAGVSAMTLGILSLFLIAFFDNSLSSPLQFHKMTHLPLLGAVNKLKGKEIDLGFLFSLNDADKHAAHFKETIRRIRHSIEQSGGKVFLFTSNKPAEGKSFVIVSLAYALGLKGKKVLVFDTNFKHNTLTQFGNAVITQHDSVPGLPIRANIQNVQFVGNKEGNFSPSEVLGANFKEKLQMLRGQFDYIFLEAASLNKYADTHELAEYADKIVPVFSAETSIHTEDKEALKYFQSLNGKMMGAVLNQVQMSKMKM